MGSKSNQVKGNHSVPEQAALEGEIRETRQNMSQTVEEIEQKLKPERLKDEAMDKLDDLKVKLKAELMEEFEEAKSKLRAELQDAKGAMREATIGRVEHMVHDAQETVNDVGTTIVDAVKANPVPAAMIGIGLGWLLISARQQRDSFRYGRGQAPYGAYGMEDDYEMLDRGGRFSAAEERAKDWARSAQSRIGQTTHHLQDRTSRLAREAQQRVGDTAHHLQDDAGRWVDETQERLHQLRDQAGREARDAEAYVQRAMQDNPLAIGAVAFALGAATGLALPHTQREDQLLGSTRERLMDKVANAAARVALSTGTAPLR
jgi:ElaB/YqjD/DUF883 family membrane-anchored ribosome-binding protein